MSTKKARKSAFVPRVLVRTAIVGVIPACAVACGSSAEPSSPATDAGHDTGLLGVAAVAYLAYDSGAPDAAADAAQADAAQVDAAPDVFFLGVATVAFQGYESGAPDADADGAPADAEPDAFRGRPPPLAVTAYEVGPPKRRGGG